MASDHSVATRARFVQQLKHGQGNYRDWFKLRQQAQAPQVGANGVPVDPQLAALQSSQAQQAAQTEIRTAMLQPGPLSFPSPTFAAPNSGLPNGGILNGQPPAVSSRPVPAVTPIVRPPVGSAPPPAAPPVSAPPYEIPPVPAAIPYAAPPPVGSPIPPAVSPVVATATTAAAPPPAAPTIAEALAAPPAAPAISPAQAVPSAPLTTWEATQQAIQEYQAAHPPDAAAQAAAAQRNQEDAAYSAARDYAIGVRPDTAVGFGDEAARQTRLTGSSEAFAAFNASGYTGAQALADGWLGGIGRQGWVTPPSATAPSAPPVSPYFVPADERLTHPASDPTADLASAIQSSNATQTPAAPVPPVSPQSPDPGAQHRNHARLQSALNSQNGNNSTDGLAYGGTFKGTP